MSLTKLRNINNSKEADILGSNASKCRLGKWSDNIGRKASTTTDREEKLKKNWLMIRVLQCQSVIAPCFYLECLRVT
ncbi:unnamed protein product [Nippostrongylus brasiliensis]|uniref:Uncharacterized protein n=1 Tax=Nippostrongylus brasiliensis TaxID=27835 RepID=A0A0N4YPD8_NIPBR|nr:unnamed protein product [Nippostrongylus brasiliensis]